MDWLSRGTGIAASIPAARGRGTGAPTPGWGPQGSSPIALRRSALLRNNRLDSGRNISSAAGSDVPASRVAEDIPMARRMQPAPPRRASLRRRLSWLLLACGLFSGSAVLLARGPLRSVLTPPPVAGLNARLSRDGRLLGHFPYPEASAANLVTFAPGQQLHRDAAEALGAMQRAAALDGVGLVVLSAFRSIALQNRIFFDVKAERNQTSLTRARVSAPPGFSEHSTGYAVDLGDASAPATNLSPSFDQTAAFRWLAANAARFHFQLSFPEGNPQGVSYEPWHWRYEGTTEALRLFEPAQRLAR
ncbi:M15 family metallopeptidase [Synechococcus sp. CBW1004]|nr:M15 family metallopeptidase [Synechococcus sp. CBW1004]